MATENSVYSLTTGYETYVNSTLKAGLPVMSFQNFICALDPPRAAAAESPTELMERAERLAAAWTYLSSSDRLLHLNLLQLYGDSAGTLLALVRAKLDAKIEANRKAPEAEEAKPAAMTPDPNITIRPVSIGGESLFVAEYEKDGQIFSTPPMTSPLLSIGCLVVSYPFLFRVHVIDIDGQPSSNWFVTRDKKTEGK